MSGDEKSEIERLRAEVRRLSEQDGRSEAFCKEMIARCSQALSAVAKLPKTADGVPIVPGMKVYGCQGAPAAVATGGSAPIVESVVGSVGTGSDWFSVSLPWVAQCGNNYWSTREAAEAARARVLAEARR